MKISKELAKRIQVAKKRMSDLDFADGPHHWHDSDQGSVACCLYSRADTHALIYMDRRICHAEVSYLKYKTDFILDHIQFSDRVPFEKEEAIQFLQYVMDHPIFGKSFLERDAEKAWEERIMVRDLEALPSNVTMLCLILTRALWEHYQYDLPKRFSTFVKLGFTPDQALVASHHFNPENNHYSPLMASGHNAFDHSVMWTDWYKNFIDHKIIHKSDKTLGEGGKTSGGYGKTRYCVDNVFGDGGYDEDYRKIQPGGEPLFKKPPGGVSDPKKILERLNQVMEKK